MEQNGWFVAVGEESRGPINIDELYKWLDEQRITVEHYVWHETLGEWKRIADVLPLQGHARGEPAAEPQPEKGAQEEQKSVETFYCEKHPDKPAEGLCAQCKKDFCEDCLTSRNGKFYCPDCTTTAEPEKKGIFSKLFSKKHLNNMTPVII